MKLSTYFSLPKADKLAEEYPKGSYQIVSMSEPKPVNLSVALISAGMQEQEFRTLVLRKVVQKGHIDQTKPIRKTIFSLTNQVAWDIIEKTVTEEKKDFSTIIFDNCRLLQVQSNKPYYPTRKDPDTGEVTRLTYPQDKGQHKAGDDIQTSNHKIFLFSDDDISVTLGRLVNSVEWVPDSEIESVEVETAEDVQ